MPPTEEWFNDNPIYPDERRSPSNSNWVCFNCRSAVRYSKDSKVNPRCLICDQVMLHIGSKRAVPKKDDVKAWEKWKTACDKRLLSN